MPHALIRAEGSVITVSGGNQAASAGAILSLIFAEGTRPGIDALYKLADTAGSKLPFAITHAAQADEGWVELLAMGLTFDCAGLRPGASAPQPPKGTLLGIEAAPLGEVLTLAPAPHLADAPGMLPVVRALAGIGTRLAELDGVQAAVWKPAQSWMAPAYFRKIVGNWAAGGPFPALGLTTLERESDGGIVTHGMELLTGQELRFVPDRLLGAADIARIAVRLVHALIEVDPLEIAHEFTGPEGEVIDVVPNASGRQLRVSVRR